MKKLSEEEKLERLRVARRREARTRNRVLRRAQTKAQRAAFHRELVSFTQAHKLKMPTDVDRVPILLPKILSLRDNYAATVSAIAELRDAVLLRNTPAMLYFDHVQEIEPAATLLLVAEVFRCRNLRPFGGKNRMVHGTYPAKMDVLLQLRDMGFYDLIGINPRNELPDDRESEHRREFLPFHSFNRAMPSVPRELSDWINDNAIPMSDVERRRMNEALKEAMFNAIDHAYAEAGKFPRMKNRWWLGGFIHAERQEMMLIVLDQGIGIPRSLQAKFSEKVVSLVTTWTLQPSDGEMIKYATELFRTSTGQSGRGRGFRDMKRFVDESTDGELRVLSNRGVYHYMKSGERVDDNERSIGGTLLEWRIRKAVEVKEVEDA
ncbi:ATP-binding protein [Sphingomonas sp. OTU376]|uniref:ATP-binding protein n=1 Tax=Sphingomonas sp. OTU376 TaxID=3043863 RepID=UPI00313CD537